MWRTDFTKLKEFARGLDEVLFEVEADQELIERANRTISKARKKYPVLADALDSPQSADKHAEGPRLEDHVRHILIVLYGLFDGRFHLLDLEEFRRLKGYEGEIEEIEETIKERAAFFEAFALAHDIGKGAALVFRTPEESKGAKEGLGRSVALGWEEYGGEGRLIARKKYDDLFETFAADHQDLEPKIVQAEFFKEYRISVSNRGHERFAHMPHFQEVIRSLGGEYRLPEKDIDLLVMAIASHMKPVHSFWRRADFKDYDRLVKYSVKMGYDPDDFLDLLLAGTTLDVCFGSEQLTDRGYKHYPGVTINFLKAEHDWGPQKRREAEEKRKDKKKKKRNKIYKEVGLDGDALLELLQMTPGPEFGKLLRQIQGAVEDPAMIPELDRAVTQIIIQRISAAREKMSSL